MDGAGSHPPTSVRKACASRTSHHALSSILPPLCGLSLARLRPAVHCESARQSAGPANRKRHLGLPGQRSIRCLCTVILPSDEKKRGCRKRRIRGARLTRLRGSCSHFVSRFTYTVPPPSPVKSFFTLRRIGRKTKWAPPPLLLTARSASTAMWRPNAG